MVNLPHVFNLRVTGHMGKPTVLTILTVSKGEVKTTRLLDLGITGIAVNIYTSTLVVTWHGIIENAQRLGMVPEANEFRVWFLNQLDQWGAVEPEGPENSFLKETGVASVVQSDQRDGMDQIGAPHFPWTNPGFFVDGVSIMCHLWQLINMI